MGARAPVSLPSDITTPTVINDPGRDSLDRQAASSFSGSDYDVFMHIPLSSRDAFADSLISSGADRDEVTKLLYDVDPFFRLESITSLSINTYRESTPIRPLGFSSPVAISRGSRTVAGTMTNLVLAESMFSSIAIYDILNERYPDLRVTYDMLPPFNLFIYAMAEDGVVASASVLGITIITGGTSIGVFDSYTEETFEFVAEAYVPLNKDIGIADRDATARALRGKRRYERLYGEFKKIVSDVVDFTRDPVGFFFDSEDE